jgi:hypothetical protein
MRRRIFALAATAGLVLAAFAGPVMAEQASPAAAATEQAVIQNATVLCVIPAVYCYSNYIDGNGVGKRVTLNSIDATTFENTGQSGKWTEIKDTSNGYCLDLTGSASAGYYVNEESCNGRSAELWWVVDGVQGDATQIISQYGTTLLGHDACMWENADTATQLDVVDCVSKNPPTNQIWGWDDNN